MMKISEKDMAAYRAGAERRWQEEQQQLSMRYERAWIFARKASDMLKKQFGARQVAVFGSLVHKDLFHQNSDVDLAVWGIKEKEYFRAVSCLMDLDSEISADLVMAEDAKPALGNRIQTEGIKI
ncbi:MAG: nucleotidyltransferase family protein [Desulfococcaceae bacterium]